VRIDLRIIALPVEGRAQAAADSVAQQTSPPLPVDLPAASRVEDLIRTAAELGAWTSELQEVLLTGQAVSWATPLHDGDAVTLLGPVATP